MEKVIWLDMDGTVADLYGVADWLQFLRNEDTLPYRRAAFMLSAETLKAMADFVENGGEIKVVSWASKTGSPEYNKRVRSAKEYWLQKNLPFVSELHVVKYGTPKSDYVKEGEILIDDEINNLIDIINHGGFGFSPDMLDAVLAMFEE